MDGHTDRQTDRQTDRLTNRQAGRQADRQAGRQADRRVYVEVGRLANRQRDFLIPWTVLKLFTKNHFSSSNEQKKNKRVRAQ